MGVVKLLDIHNHILPGLDDGALHMDESLRMAELMVNEGFRGVISTPHFGKAGFCSDSVTIRKRVCALNKELQTHRIDLIVYPGMEILLCPEIPDLLRQKKVLSLNDGKYVLIELPSLGIPAGLNNFVAQLLRENKKLVIAHPEKNHGVHRRPDQLLKLVDSHQPGDILVQITADSLTGAAGEEVFRTAKFMLKARLVHVIATDAHSSILRPPSIKAALTIATAIVGRARAMKMVCDWPKQILLGEDVIPERLVMRKKKWAFFKNEEFKRLGRAFGL